jgi:hypothetical protein
MKSSHRKEGKQEGGGLGHSPSPPIENKGTRRGRTWSITKSSHTKQWKQEGGGLGQSPSPPIENKGNKKVEDLVNHQVLPYKTMETRKGRAWLITKSSH